MNDKQNQKALLARYRQLPNFKRAQAVLDALYATTESRSQAMLRALQSEHLKFISGDRLAVYEGGPWKIKVQITKRGWALLDTLGYSEREWMTSKDLCNAIIEKLAFVEAGIHDLKPTQVCTSQQEAEITGGAQVDARA
jgi:hypothetical protein